MRNFQRLLAFGVLAALGFALGAVFAAPDMRLMQGAPAALLPAAQANPVDVSVADTLKRGETLSQLLKRVRLADVDASALLATLRQHGGDPRRINPGSVISYRRSFTDGSVREMVFKLDADRILNMQRTGKEWTGEISEVPVYPDTAVLSGTVLSSLYSALLYGEGDLAHAERQTVADELADRVFPWQIDFSRDIRKGDSYRILYERDVRPDGTTRGGRILAAQFSINGRDYEAYRMTTPDGKDEYFERNGQSLKRAFLKAPLQFRRISSSFSLSRFHPILQRSRAHAGIDYAASAGTPVRAVADGVVITAGRSGGYGNLVEILHANGYTTRYAHLRGFATGLRRGMQVRQEDVVGYVGMTGLATGPHLHFEYRRNGAPVNPNRMPQIEGKPVPPERRGEFAATVERQILALDASAPPVLLADARNSVKARASE